jgi:hypothetical protein
MKIETLEEYIARGGKINRVTYSDGDYPVIIQMDLIIKKVEGLLSDEVVKLLNDIAKFSAKNTDHQPNTFIKLKHGAFIWRSLYWKTDGE